ncbi:TetR/AcrR family transcriptional regulator [Qaidamihabitans albus]|uniref:TetR/AcrR family transcriptional regulator n=1 Tax=Qaidamihabitans albus TaxID=2795733 RepID=UPI0018F1866D|nr:TetR/AcrR family transcriptional regulator [Qaidamihabitans albus]
MSDSVKRQYRSPRRAAAAAATRARIRNAAALLFVQRGYVATTMKEVAAAAEVGERTLYDAFPSKPVLFGHTLGVATVGDEQPVRVSDRPEIIAAREAPDPELAIKQIVSYTVPLLERASDLIMVSVEAAGADPDMRAAADAGASATHEVCSAFTMALHERGLLRDGLDAITAADIMYALSSPHMHQLLRRHRRWSVPHYQAWLESSLIQQLLRTNGASTRTTRGRAQG